MSVWVGVARFLVRTIGALDMAVWLFATMLPVSFTAISLWECRFDTAVFMAIVSMMGVVGLYGSIDRFNDNLKLTEKW